MLLLNFKGQNEDSNPGLLLPGFLISPPAGVKGKEESVGKSERKELIPVECLIFQVARLLYMLLNANNIKMALNDSEAQEKLSTVLLV